MRNYRIDPSHLPYDNQKIAKGQTTRVVNDAEAAVVRTIYERFADGDGLRTIALALNGDRALSPRAQQGRPNGWSSSSVREALRQPESAWVQREVPELRIVDADLAARVDQRRERWRVRAVEAAKQNRAPQNASGKYLLTGGLLICPTCGGHFEAFKSPWKRDGVYVCATRRRKPGVCSNMLALPMALADEAVLEMVEGEVLGTRFIEELLSLVDKGDAQNAARLTVERERLQREMSNLLGLAPTIGTPVTTQYSVRDFLSSTLR